MKVDGVAATGGWVATAGGSLLFLICIYMYTYIYIYMYIYIYTYIYLIINREHRIV
jgi:hypothetical protein